MGRGYAVMETIGGQARAAYAEMAAAQAAFGDSDFSGSERHFKTAGDLLESARQSWRAAMASSSYVLAYPDLTGTIRSGDQLLAAGESVVEAGAALAGGMESILAGQEDLPVSLVDALEQALAAGENAHAALVDAEKSLERVAVVTLPNDIKEEVVRMKKNVPAARASLGSWLDQSHVLLSILGAERARDYLLVLQNNHEMRPTGGFIGSLALVGVDRGVVEDIAVQTVYDGDGQLKDFIAPPDPLRLIVDRWYLRDANWFVNYPQSAKKIVNFLEKEGGPTVDGVIALTPEVIKGLLEMTGPVTVPEYNVVVDAESFVPLTQELVTYSYDRAVNKPKQFLADLAPILLNRIFADKSKMLEVMSLLAEKAEEKHLLVYFTDAEEQERIVRQGWAGALPADAPHMLNIVNANIGGHKSDQFMTQEIDYRISVQENGEAEALVTIRRTHNGPTEKLDLPYVEDNNPAYKDNVVWQRVLVPIGAQLLEATGFTSAAEVPRQVEPTEDALVQPDADVAEWQRRQHVGAGGTTIGEESHYQYFANWMVTKPGATSIGLYRYRLPRLDLPGVLRRADTVAAYVAKQPGDVRSELRVELKLPSNLRVVHTVPDDGITRVDEETIVYRGALRRDVLIGAVVEY